MTFVCFGLALAAAPAGAAGKTDLSRRVTIDVDRFFCSLGSVEFERGPAGEVVGFTLTPSDERTGFPKLELVKVM